MSGVFLRISAAFLVSALAVLAGSLYLSDRYTSEQRSLTVAGDTQGAAEAAQRAVRLDPFSPDPLEAQSYLFQQQNMNQRAADSLKEAIRRNPKDYEPYFMLGSLQSNSLNDFDAAVENYRKALDLNPKAYTVRTSLAQTLTKQVKLEEARKEYEKLAEAKQISYQGLYDLGRIYVRTGDPKKGYKTIKKAERRASAQAERLSEGPLKEQTKELVVSMQLAQADALVVEGRYGAARRLITESSSDQAAALLELLNADPESYRESVLDSEIY